VVHEAQHSGTAADRIEINGFFMRQAAHRVKRLASVLLPDGRRLLDDTWVVMVSEMATGAHGLELVPFIVTGGGNGHFRLGRVLSLPSTLQHTRLLASVMHAMGRTDIRRFGEFTEPNASGLLPGASG